MDKSWDELSDPGKIQALRIELLLLGNRVNELSAKHDALSYKHTALATLGDAAK